MNRRSLLAFAAGAVALLGIALVVLVQASKPPSSPSLSSSTAASTAVPGIGGPFEMVDTHGAAVTQADLLGKPSVLFFGFTFCPEVCPTTLSELTTLMGQLGPEADKLNYVFVTVDPDRDTPDQLRQYLLAFDGRIRGFTGTQAQVDAIAKAYRAYHRRVPTPDGGYTMDHTAIVYLMDAKGGFVGTISYEEEQATALAKLKRLTGMAG